MVKRGRRSIATTPPGHSHHTYCTPKGRNFASKYTAAGGYTDVSTTLTTVSILYDINSPINHTATGGYTNVNTIGLIVPSRNLTATGGYTDVSTTLTTARAAMW